MNIAMFTDAYFPRINGVAVSVNSYATELSRLGHKVCVVCPKYTKKQEQKFSFNSQQKDNKSPFEIFRLPSTRLPFSKEDRMVHIDKWFSVKKYMDHFKPTVIHINSEPTVGYLGMMYAKYKNIPCVFTFHTLWEEYMKNYIHCLPDFLLKKLGRDAVKFYLKRADIIITPTKRIAGVAKKYGVETEINILPTGIPYDEEDFTYSHFKTLYANFYRRFPELKGRNILLFVGRIVKEKNLLFLYDMLERVREKIPSAALLFVGGGPFLDEIKDIAFEQGLTSSVFFAGYVPQTDIFYYYHLAQLFVFPSKTETQGLVTVEAMLSGLPVVAIGEMGTIDVMQGNNGGFMVKDNIEEFSSRVIELLSDDELRKSKAVEALQWAGKLKISNLTPHLVDCYNKAIAICTQQKKVGRKINKPLRQTNAAAPS